MGGAVIGFGQTTIALARATAPLAGGYLFDFDKDSTILMNLFHIQDVQDIYLGHEKYEQPADSGDVIFLAASIGTALVAVLISFLPTKYGSPIPQKKKPARAQADTESKSTEESKSSPQSQPSPGSDFLSPEEPLLYPQSELSPEVSPHDQAGAPFEDV